MPGRAFHPVFRGLRMKHLVRAAAEYLELVLRPRGDIVVNAERIVAIEVRMAENTFARGRKYLVEQGRLTVTRAHGKTSYHWNDEAIAKLDELAAQMEKTAKSFVSLH